MTFANDADAAAVPALCSCAPGSSVQDACTGTDFQDCVASCDECPIDTYSEVDTKTTYACLQCSDYIVGSTTNNAKGVTSKEDCKCLQGSGKIVHEGECKCPAGKFFDSISNTCQSCADGWYKSEPGNEPCIECGLKKTTDGRIGEVRQRRGTTKYTA